MHGPYEYRAAPTCECVYVCVCAGFVWDTKGHIVTNYHVIRGASDVLVHCSPLCGAWVAACQSVCLLVCLLAC